MTLSKLERSGHLRSVRRRIVIRDPAGLEALAFDATFRRRPRGASGSARAAPARPASSHP
jgi:hypothetical protein